MELKITQHNKTNESQEYLSTPLWDVTLSPKERLTYLLNELTLEEKLHSLGTGCPDIPRLGIKAFGVGGEGAHGVQARHDQEWDTHNGPDYTTVFTNPIGMAMTWDQELIRKAGRVTGMEARALFLADKNENLSLWAPTIDMERDPRWGRTEEGYGEDPVLAGAMAGAYVDGMQGDDPNHLLTGATVKHFYANNVEWERCFTSSEVDDRNREEYYFEPFRRVIVDHKAEGMMTAYNEVNNVPCMLLPQIREIVKEKWGLHHVVCDGGDVSQTVECHHYFERHEDTIATGLKVGIDCFTDAENYVYQYAKSAFEQGMFTIEELDEALFHHYGVMLRLGLFDPKGTNPYDDISLDVVSCPEHQEVARKVAGESVVLLKNDLIDANRKNDSADDSLKSNSTDDNRSGSDAGKRLLPLQKSQSIAAIGPLSDVWYKDWYSGLPPYHITPAQGLRNTFGPKMGQVCPAMDVVKVRVAYQGKTWYFGVSEPDQVIQLTDKEHAEDFEIEYWGEGKTTLRSIRTGRFVTTHDALDKGEQGFVCADSKEVFGWFIKEIFFCTKDGEEFNGEDREQLENITISIHAWNRQNLYIDGESRLCVYTGDSMQDITELSGSESEEVMDCSEKDSSITDPSKETLQISLVLETDGISQAKTAASKVDTPILFLGHHPMITCKEEVDRKGIGLPPFQQKLLEEVYDVNPNLVLVLVSSVPYGIPWAKQHVKAILTVAAGSMELGNGIASVLAGEENPAARLAMTWYQSEQDLPLITDYDIINGKRTYQYFDQSVLYPFGHGLSYTDFAYRDLDVVINKYTSKMDFYDIDGLTEQELQNKIGKITVSFFIQNTGIFAGDEVVQVYVRKHGSQWKRPLKTLVVFSREKQIPPSAERKVTLTFSLRDLTFYHPKKQCRELEPGEYEILVGASSEDIRLSQQFVIE